MENATSGFTMGIYSGSSTTAIVTGTTTTVTTDITVNTSSDIVYTVKANIDGMDLTEQKTTLYARNIIYYGFGSTATGVASLSSNKLSPTITAARTYSKTANSTSNGSFFIIVPPDISPLKQDGFTDGGAPFVMKTMYTETINGIANYKVYESAVDDYAPGVKLNVVATNA